MNYFGRRLYWLLETSTFLLFRKSIPSLNGRVSQLLVKMVKVNPDPQGDHEGTIWFDYFSVTRPLQAISPSLAQQPEKSNKIVPIVSSVGIVVILILILLFYRRRKHLSGEVEPTVRSESPIVSRELPRLLFFFVSHHCPIPAYVLKPVVQNSIDPVPVTDRFLVTPKMSQGPDRYTITLVPPSPVAGNSNLQFFSSSSTFNNNGQSSHLGSNTHTVNSDHDTPPNENRQTLETNNEVENTVLSTGHVDSGLRAIDPESIPPDGRVELPPAYTQLDP